MKFNLKKLLGTLGRALVKKYGHAVLDKVEGEALTRIRQAATVAEAKIQQEAQTARTKAGTE